MHNKDESSYSNPTKQLNINALKNPICQKAHRATVFSWTVEHISFQTSKCWHFNVARFNIRSLSTPSHFHHSPISGFVGKLTCVITECWVYNNKVFTTGNEGWAANTAKIIELQQAKFIIPGIPDERRNCFCVISQQLSVIVRMFFTVMEGQ